MKKHEREISELLENMDKFIPDEGRRRRPRLRLGDLVRRATSAMPTLNISPTSLIAACFVLALLGAFIRDIPVIRSLAPLMSIAAVALFVGAIVLHAAGSRKHPERRWRGNVIKIESYRPYSFSSMSYRWRRIWKSLWQRPRNKY